MHLEARDSSDKRLASFVDSQVCTFSHAVTPDHVITVVRKLLAWTEPRKLADDTISLHDYLGALAIGNNPFATTNKISLGRTIVNRNEIDKRKRPIWRGFQVGNIGHFFDRPMDLGYFAKSEVHVPFGFISVNVMETPVVISFAGSDNSA